MVASTCVVREKKIILFCIFTNAVLLPFYYYFQMKMNKNTFEEQLNNNTERREMEAIQWNMLDLRFAQEIRCFNLMKFMTGKYNSCREFVYGERKKYCKKNIKYAIIPAVVFGIQMFLSYYIAGDLLLKHRIDVGDFIIYAGGIWGIASGGRAFVEKLVLLKNENMYLGALGKCFLYEAQETDNTGKLSVEAFESIEFENVSFSYNSDDNYAICNLNVRITAGDKISIVGENGSGKSTFIKLLLGLYTPTKGTVYLNGKDIQLYDREQVKKLFATIFQDYMVTSYTIANNITFDDTVDETRMNVCLEMAGLREKIDSLPKGAKLAMLKKAQATGEYDSAELENAIAHAKRMVECADMKVNNLREEDRLRKRAEDKEELKVEKLRNAGRLENLKKRTHRQDENKALFDADTKYYQREGNGIVGAAASAISSAAASLELSSVSGQMRNLEITQAAIAQSSVQGQSMDVIV